MDTGLHFITHLFTYVFVTLSILQFQFIKIGFKKNESSEHNVVSLLLFTARRKEDEKRKKKLR